MNIKRRLLDLLAPKEVKEAMKLLDGKKTLIGIIIAVAPQVVDAVVQIASAAGGDADAYAKVGGAIIAILGLAHKFAKG